MKTFGLVLWTVLVFAVQCNSRIHDLQEPFDLGRQLREEVRLLGNFVHTLFAGYRLRMIEPEICDPSVQQYSGYLDIADGKHLFFWFFESRGDPTIDPLILWLNGGPGCSSSIGLLMELGPCRIAENGTKTTYNPYSWTEHANIIFLDQPVGVGWSYSDHNSTMDTSPVAGEDVYAFLQLFFEQHPQYAHLSFHIAAESYGGTYAPHFASTIHKRNKAIIEEDGGASTVLRRINLASVILANAFTSPYLQMEAVPEYACNGPYPLFDDPKGTECEELRRVTASCQCLIKKCYEENSRDACGSASVYCWTDILKPVSELGLNPNDVRKQCEPEINGVECYKEMLWIEAWMQDVRTRAALGVDTDRVFERCNEDVLERFVLSGDCMHDTALLLPELIEDGVRLLVYAGNADYLCHYIGNERWMDALEHKFHEEFAHTRAKPWVLANGHVAGAFRTAGKGREGAGNVTFVTVYDAGHLLPYDRPEAALELFTRWVQDIYLGAVDEQRMDRF